MDTQRVNSQRTGGYKKIAFSVVFVLVALWFFWWISPLNIIHGTIMFFYKNPMLWKMPIAAGLISFALFSIPAFFNKERGFKSCFVRKNNNAWYERSYDPSLPLIGAIGVFIVAFFIGAIVSAPMNHRATYKHYQFKTIENLPAVGHARILPKSVAEKMSSAGFDSPQFHLGEAHVTKSPEGGLTWTFGQLPNSLWNKFNKPTNGMLIQNAATTERDIKLDDTMFEVSPGRFFGNSVSWNAHRMNYFTDVAETVFIVTRSGDPLILAPYVKYEGFWTKVPVLAGVYVIHPDGKIDDLSLEEAAENPDIVNSGRLFPESLALSIQESYKYKNGIANRFFSHEEQTELSDDAGGNSQPYLMDFDDYGTKWVSTAKPYGRVGATNAIFFTDTVNGNTDVWFADAKDALSGNSRALDTVKGMSIPGVLFGKSGGEDSDNSGRFQALEPRPIIHNGELQFMISVVPYTNNTVTKTVIVDARRNKAVAIFNHDTDPQADKALIEYLNGDESKGKIVVGEEAINPTVEPSVGETELPTSGEASGDREKLLRELLEANRRQQEVIEALIREESDNK